MTIQRLSVEFILILVEIAGINFRAQTFTRSVVTFAGQDYPYANMTFDGESSILDWNLFLQMSRTRLRLAGSLAAGAKVGGSIRSEMLRLDGLLGQQIRMSAFLVDSTALTSVTTNELLGAEERLVQESFLSASNGATLLIESRDDCLSPWNLEAR